MPALLKGFLEQTLRPGFAFDYLDGGEVEMKLKGRSARLVVTMGMPAIAYRWFYGGHSVKSFERNILKFVGIKPVATSLYGMVEATSDVTRDGWLDELHELGKAGELRLSFPGRSAATPRRGQSIATSRPLCDSVM